MSLNWVRNRKRQVGFPLGGFVLVLLSQTCLANSFVMMADRDLVDQTPLIVEGFVMARSSAPTQRPSTDYRLAVNYVVKGQLDESEIDVRVLGGIRQDGIGLLIPGAPIFNAGERVLLFLFAREDGTYGLQQFALGAFRVVEEEGFHLAVRPLENLLEVGTPPAFDQMPEQERSRAFTRNLFSFEAWISDRSFGLDRAPDYWEAIEPQRAIDSLKRAEYLEIEGVRVRWFEFDDGTPVSWRSHTSGQPGMTGGGVGAIQNALSAWNDDAGSEINYTYGGTTSADDGFTNFDSVNAILFEDPNNEIGGSYNCASGGTLALGGPWFNANNTQNYNGTPHILIVGGDIITQDNAGCFFGGNGDADGEEVFAHELGHTLGFRHACGDAMSPSCADPVLNDALMRAQAHGDGRGALLTTDDELAAFTLYEANCDTEPLFTSQPGSQTACEGVNISFTVSAETTGTPIWQWQKNGVTIPGANSATLNLLNVTEADEGNYRCIVTDDCDTAMSNIATLTVEFGVTPASAGEDQLVCGLNTNLDGNTPSLGDGMWQIVAGNGGNISDPSNPNSGFSGIGGVTYTLRWVISEENCNPSVDTVLVKLLDLDVDGNPGVTFADFTFRASLWPDLTNPDPNLDVDGSGAFDVADLVDVLECY